MNPKRIVLILPCCIGDVLMATATLRALRHGYPDAHITWAIGKWSRQAIANHDALDALLDTGLAALPVKSPVGFWQFVGQLHTGNYDLAVSLVRSPLMSLAVRLAGIPQRAGLDSNGRGFGYNIRVPVNPQVARHEAEIYLDVARALQLYTTDCYANVPVDETHWTTVREQLESQNINPKSYIVLNPAGGLNPGMTMTSKRWPAKNFAQLADALAAKWAADIVLIGGPDDVALIDLVQAQMQSRSISLVGTLNFPEIAVLAKKARLYVGNDTGLTHLAAAAGAVVVAIFGPSDPRRYAPFSPQVLTLWKPAAINPTGVVAGTPQKWDWERDGISVEDALRRIDDQGMLRPI